MSGAPGDLSVATARIRAALERAGQLVAVRGVLPEQVSSLTDDSRRVAPHACFVAVRGSTRDGHGFLPSVAAAGGTLVITEEAIGTELPALIVRESRVAAAVAAAAFYGNPADQLRIVGVTGTNGKTTTVGILRHLLDVPAAPAASIGTLGVLMGSEGTVLPGGEGLTTPGPIELQRVLRALVDRGIRTVAMEVSSHALHQQRVVGVRFSAAVFTNITRDHLDYHVTMPAYLAAKALLIGLLEEQGVAVVNADDAAWRALPAAPCTIRFGLTEGLTEAITDVCARDVRCEPRGSRWRLTADGVSAPVILPLIGEFNVANALAAAAAAIALGHDLVGVAARLGTTPQVPGRLELLHEPPAVLRDYAHTPDALARALIALRPFTPGRIIVVFGCGGDRDRGKRPLMAEVARAHADYLVITSDNPRTEDPEAIIDEIIAPLEPGSYARIEDRREAIAHAIQVAELGHDLVLLAGKGHETYQIRGGVALPFDEKNIVRDLFLSRDGSVA